MHKGIESINRHPDLKSKLIHIAPALASAIIKKIPGG